MERLRYGGVSMRRWMKAAVAAVAVLGLGGWIAAPYVKDRWLVRTACDGALPAGAVRQLAVGGGHFTEADTTSHPRLGDYGCSLHFEGRGEHTLVVRMAAYVRRDDQDSAFLAAFPQEAFAALHPLPRHLPGFVDSFGDFQFLLHCPDLGKDAEGRPRRLLVSAVVGDATARTSHAVYETVIPLVNSASTRLGCGAEPLKVPKGDVAPPDREKEPKPLPVREAAGTACGWVAGARLPQAARWQVRILMNDAAPAGRCDLIRGGETSESGKNLDFAAWYGDWSNRVVSYDGVRRPLMATARCAGEAANFAVSAPKDIPGVGREEQRGLLRAFARDQVERRGCFGLRLTG
ncbi:hypothetical protein [Streptomyces sp. NPDC048521]|uniref:hypothetical protein n=1 Tax=Streptomyces sp. NPDC048521 TaxID=3365566 RepID=UPI00371E38DB